MAIKDREIMKNRIGDLYHPNSSLHPDLNVKNKKTSTKIINKHGMGIDWNK